jgi:hypothetical protein
MPLTRDFKDTIVERARRDKKFRRGMLMRGIALIIAGNKEDMQAGKSFIRDYINATIGFAALSERTGIPKESLMRMLGPSGNPALNNLNQVTHTLLASEGVKEADGLKVSVQA